MKTDFYTKKKWCAIFALVLRNKQLAYVGKTTSPRLSAVYSSHICGKYRATKSDFNKNQKPDLHLLEVINCTGAEAYKHVLAWINIFMEDGYCCLNPCRSLDQADEPFTDTAMLIKEFQSESFELIMKRTYICNPSDADRMLREIMYKLDPTIHEPMTQMNIRIRQKDKQIFEKFCKDFSINQREGFTILLDKIDGSMGHLQELLADRQDKSQKFQEEILKLQNKISGLNRTEHILQDKNIENIRL